MKQAARRFKTWATGLPRRDGAQDFERPLRNCRARLSGVERLPLVHVTTVWGARQVLETAKLAVKKCDVFGVDLVYFFVLRPAYLSKLGNEKTHFLDYFPVAFVLKPSAVPMPYHAYPFDTGGAARGAFRSKANKLIPLEDYEIENSHEAVAGFVGWAFGGLPSYYDGILSPTLQSEVRPADSVATGYISIAKMGVIGDPDHDTRASTVELTSSQNVDVLGNVMLVVLPMQLLEDKGRFPDALTRLTDSGAKIEVYDWRPNRAPDEYQRDLLRITRTWYQRQGLEV